MLPGKKLTGKGGVLTPLIKELVETALSAELDSHIAQDVLNRRKNRKNGSTSNSPYFP
jgi:transposase-like protein